MYNMCACRLYNNHIYPQNQTGGSYDAPIKFYVDKRKTMLILEISCPFKCNLDYTRFDTLKKSTFANMTLVLKCRLKNFLKLLMRNMYACRIHNNHSYPQNQTGRSYNAPIKFYVDKRKTMLIFEFS